MKESIKQLDGTIRRARQLLVARRASITLSFLILATLLLSIIDWYLRLQFGFRLIVFTALMISMLAFLVLWIIPSIRFSPSRRAMALLFEEQNPRIRGRLASGIEFESSGIGRENPLAAASIQETSRRMRGVSTRSLIDVRPAVTSLLIFIVLILIVGCLFTIKPVDSKIGVSRILTPWTETRWPPRTSVLSRMETIVPEHGVHGRSIPLVLRAQNTTPGDPEGTIEASYRFITNGITTNWNTVVLTHQRDGIHERVVAVDGDRIELKFKTFDAESPVDGFRILEVPEITSISLGVVPPDHARSWIQDRVIEPDNRVSGIEIVQQPVMEGSDLTLHLELNREIAIPSDPDLNREWLNTTLGVNRNTSSFDLQVDPEKPESWTIRWKADETERMLITLNDEYGLQSDASVPMLIIVEPDSIPDVVLLKPERDLDVLPMANIVLSVKAVDDLPLRSMGIEIFRESNQLIKSDTDEQRIDDGRFDSTFDLSESGIVEGDVLQINGLAVDQWTDESGSNRTTRSRSRTIRVVTEPEFLSQIRNQMSLIEQRSMDLEDRQVEIKESFRELIESTQTNGSGFTGSESTPISDATSSSIRALEKQQSDMTRLMNDQLESTRSIRDWLESNGMVDETMQSVLDQVSEALQDGAQSSTEALQSMESLRSSESSSSESSSSKSPSGESSSSESPPGESPSDKDPSSQESSPDSDVLDKQSDVQEALQDVVRALSEDQDSWLITRQLDRIRSDQQILQSETRRLSRELNGRPLDDSDPDIQSSIQEAARRQQSLLSDLSDLARELEQQVENTSDVDPASSEALKDVMDEARESQIESAMSEASSQIEDGRMQMADASQQQALEALDRMKESMTPDAKDRINDLLRRLSDLEQSIQRLVDIQTSEIDKLDESIATSNFDQRDDGMIELRSMTIATTSGISRRTEEEKMIAKRLEKASDAQTRAVGLLRSSPVDAQATRLQEEISLQQLTEAIGDVEELQAKSEQEMVETERVELAQLYRDMSDTQLDIRNRTGELLESDKGIRRTRHESRRLALEQKTLAERSEQVRSENAEIEERPIFILMHERIKNLSDEVSGLLTSSSADESTLSNQGTLARDYLAMAESLESESTDEDEFERRTGNSRGSQDGQQGDSSDGSGQNQIIPPIAELRLLRSLQFDLMESTRLMDQNGNRNIETREEEFRRLSDLQSQLAELGQEMFDRHMDESLPDEMSTEQVLPPSKWFDENPPKPIEDNPTDGSIDLKSLDELLGLDSESSSVDPTPLPENHDPLEAIIDEMERAAILIGSDLNPGPPTQRLQQDILRRIDSLIDQAQEQQSNQQSSQSSSQQSPDQQKSEDQQQQMDQQQSGEQAEASRKTDSKSGESDPGSMEAMDPRLGGALDENGREWGSLPSRIRELLQQGRRDTYSNVYEKLTGEYYRRIAEQEGDS